MTHLNDAERRDLDETRRLLYMALFANLPQPARKRARNSELLATIVNALVHHQRSEFSAQLIARKIADALGPDYHQDALSAQEWIRDRINDISDKLGDS